MQTTIKTLSKSKKAIQTIALIFVLFFTQNPVQSSTFNQDTTTYVKIWVEGMACPFCSYGIEKNITNIEGASHFFVEINEGYISFSVPTKKLPTEKELRGLIVDAGFSAPKIEFSDTDFPRKEKQTEKKKKKH